MRLDSLPQLRRPVLRARVGRALRGRLLRARAAGLLACSVPIVFGLQLQRARCGPHQGSSMVQAITSAAAAGPSCAGPDPCRVLAVACGCVWVRVILQHSWLTKSAVQPLTKCMRAWAGSVLLSILMWLVSPVVLGCLAVLLAFWLIVAQGQRARFRREKSKLRSEFDSYRREMQAKARPRPAPGARTPLRRTYIPSA